MHTGFPGDFEKVGPFPEHCRVREDYSGAFDGFGVISDADPGL